MNSWSLRFTLVFSFGFAATLTAGVGLFGFVNQQTILHATQSLVKEEMPKLNHVSEMRRMVREALGLFLQVGMVGNDEKETTRLKTKVLKTFADTEVELKAIESASNSEGEQALIAKIRITYEVVRTDITGMLDTAAQKDYASHEALGKFYRDIFKTHRFALYDAYDNLYDAYKAKTAEIIAQSESQAARSNMITLFVVLLGCMSVLFAGTWIAVRLSRELQSVSNQLGSETKEVKSSSHLLSEVANQLAENMGVQSTAVQETAASIEEISSMIQRSADNARNSCEVSRVTSNKAEEGRAVAAEVVTSMQEIRESNEAIMICVEKSNQELSKIVTVISEIGSKTKVIHDIVFQTKLLSFNASVEAARAGENGKGFAVVAEEVGNLAAMSGAAAKEITEILDKSVTVVGNIVSETRTNVDRLVRVGKDKVEHGVKTAMKSDDVLQELALNVNKVNQLISEISVASGEQALGVQEISRAISQFEKVTQGNLISSQKVSSASSDLWSNSEQLDLLTQTLSTTISGENSFDQASREATIQDTEVESQKRAA